MVHQDLQRELVLKEAVVADRVHHVALRLGQGLHRGIVAPKPPQQRLRQVHREDGDQRTPGIARVIAQDVVAQAGAQLTAGFQKLADSHLAIHVTRLVVVAVAGEGCRRICEELRAKSVARARQAQRRQVQTLLGRLVSAAAAHRQVEGVGDRQRASVGLQPVLDQLRRRDRLRFPRRVRGVDGKGVGVAEDLRFVLLNNPINLFVRRALIMPRRAAEQKQCARQDREKTPGHDDTAPLARFSGLSFTHRMADSGRRLEASGYEPPPQDTRPKRGCISAPRTACQAVALSSPPVLSAGRARIAASHLTNLPASKFMGFQTCRTGNRLDFCRSIIARKR